jgi:hypothetical protein
VRVGQRGVRHAPRSRAIRGGGSGTRGGRPDTEAPWRSRAHRLLPLPCRSRRGPGRRLVERLPHLLLRFRIFHTPEGEGVIARLIRSDITRGPVLGATPGTAALGVTAARCPVDEETVRAEERAPREGLMRKLAVGRGDGGLFATAAGPARAGLASASSSSPAGATPAPQSSRTSPATATASATRSTGVPSGHSAAGADAADAAGAWESAGNNGGEWTASLELATTVETMITREASLSTVLPCAAAAAAAASRALAAFRSARAALRSAAAFAAAFAAARFFSSSSFADWYMKPPKR